MIHISNLTPLHMDIDPQVDPDPKVELNANSTCTCGKGCKNPHSYIQSGQSGLTYCKILPFFGGSGFAHSSGSVVVSGSSDGADSTEDLNPDPTCLAMMPIPDPNPGKNGFMTPLG